MIITYFYIFNTGSLNTKSITVYFHYNLITVEKKQCNFIRNNGKIISKVESKESSKNFATCKTAQIRETRTSRLRAASIVLPNGK